MDTLTSPGEWCVEPVLLPDQLADPGHFHGLLTATILSGHTAQDTQHQASLS